MLTFVWYFFLNDCIWYFLRFATNLFAAMIVSKVISYKSWVELSLLVQCMQYEYLGRYRVVIPKNWEFMEQNNCHLASFIKCCSKFFQKVQEIQKTIEFSLTGPNLRKSQILFHKKIPSQNFIKSTLIVFVTFVAKKC